MQVADERQVRMAARLYEMRDTARRLLGAEYACKMAELGAALKTAADTTQREPLAVAIEAAGDAHGLTQCYILAAAVELAEPSAQRVNPRDALPAERECCGTFNGSAHRATCRRHKRHNVRAKAPT